MKAKTLKHGFDQPLIHTYNYTVDYLYIYERPFNSMGDSILRSIKLVGSTTNTTPRIKIALLEETNQYKKFKVVWTGVLVNNGKYGSNIYYIEGLNVRCPKAVYLGVMYEKGNNEYRNSLFTDANNSQWYNRRIDTLTIDTLVEGLEIDIKSASRQGFHFPLEFQFDVIEAPKILFKDESGEYKRYIHEHYENLASATSSSTHITSSATHANHPNSLWQAFDGDENTAWVSATGNTFPKFIKYDFGLPTPIDRFEMTPAMINKNVDYWGIKYWTLLGSNDDVNWVELFKSDSTTVSTNLDYYNQYNGSQVRFINFNRYQPTYRYYKIEFNGSHYTTAPYDYVVAVSSIKFMKKVSSGWESIGLNAGEAEYLQYGMSIEDVELLTQDELSLLQGVYSLQVYVEDPNVNKISLIKDKEEVIWLENETTSQFDVVRYTDDMFKNEAELIVDNGKKTLYDYFPNDIDVSIYSEDTNLNDKKIEVSQNYSPLDELSGDIEIYEYSDKDKGKSLVPIKKKLDEDFVHSVDGAYVDSVDINLNDAIKGKVKKVVVY